MISKVCKNKKAFTLVEMLVVVSIFAVISISVVQTFNVFVLAQEKALASKEMQENIRYAFEVISKEIRMVRVDNDGICVTQGDAYWVDPTGDQLYFLNQYNQCVHYFMESGRFKIKRGDKPSVFVTPSSLNVSNLQFSVVGSLPSEQPRVTVLIKTNPVSTKISGMDMSLQTTLSTRHYE